MHRKPAISVVEIVIVLVVFALIALIAVPQLGRADQPDERELLRTRLQVLRVAVERYYQDHAQWPGTVPGEACDGALLVAQLTQPTNLDGEVSEFDDADHPYGPYLRDGIPECPIPPLVGRTGIHVIVDEPAPSYVGAAPQAGWLYDCLTGQVSVNSDGLDRTGRPFASY